MSTRDLLPGRSRARRGVGWRRRLGVGTVVSAVLSALVAVATPGAAQAATLCSNPPNLGNAWFISRDWVGDSLHDVLTVFYLLEPPVEVFEKVEGKEVNNQVPTPTPVTFSHSQSSQRTFTITTSQSNTVSVQGQLSTSFQTMASQSIQQQFTTTIGFSATATAPPFSRLVGDFGVKVWKLHYNMQRWEIGRGLCWWRPEMARLNVFASAPTNTQVWDIRLA